jgi:hypothetical protein
MDWDYVSSITTKLARKICHIENKSTYNVVRDFLEVLLAKTTRSHGWSTNTQTRWVDGRLVTGNRILVACNVDFLKESLNAGTVSLLRAQIEKNHMRVSAIGNKSVAKLLELGFESFRILDDALLVLSEFRSGCLLQSDCDGGDCVVVGSTLVSWEDREVDGL